jgi:type I restriction enzyme R subunit
MSNLHQEHHFEAAICASLAAQGWLYAENDAALYDRQNALFLPDLLDWLVATQPDSVQKLEKSHGAALEKVLAERVRKSLNERGTLEVLRRGVEMLGLKQPLSLAQFKPAFVLNPVILQHYAANRLRVVRQVHHSLNNPKDSLDLVMFLNGIPVATTELKSDFTQSVGDAVDQYRFDRDPAPKGGMFEPLLSFPGGALVHFAVSHSEVMMATRLEGTGTRFLPSTRATRVRRAIRPIRMVLPPPTFGKTSGGGQAGWKSWGATSSANATTRSNSPASSSPAITNWTPPGSWWPMCWRVVANAAPASVT